MRRVPPVSLTSCVLALALVACTSGNEKKPSTGAAGTGAGAAGSTGMTGTAGSTGMTGTGGSPSGTAGAGTAGAAATAGASGTAGTVGTAGTSGTAGAGTAGGAGASNNDGSTEHNPDGGVTTTAGCAGHNYQLCLDFENGLDTTVWGTHANAGAIETTQVAHGTHAYHLYSSDKTAPQGGTMVATNLGTLKDQIWGRFYIHFSPGAPGNHGNLVAASDGVWCQGCPGSNYNGNWYEIGWQFDGILGDFHLENNMERPLRSKPYIVDQWYCVELFFDGTVKGDERWWIDGQEAQYYTPNSTTNPTTPMSVLIPQFKSITVGWTPYQGLGLMLPDQNKIIDNRQLNDAWIDDVAFDTQRIGCIQ
jgi:hypothetical protein